MNILYVKMKASANVYRKSIKTDDIAELFCSNPEIKHQALGIKVGNIISIKEEHVIVDIMKVIEQITVQIKDVEVIPIGETDTVVHFVAPDTKQNRVMKIIRQNGKILFVAAICFCGTAFTIMSFHTDIGIRNLFEDFYRVFGLEYRDGLGVFELFYSLGLGIGIIIFFNHFGKKKMTEDPTPLQVEMNTYESNVNQTLVENEDKK